MFEVTNTIPNFESARERLGEIQKMQSELVTKVLNDGMSLQQKQYSLLTNILQNQMEFSRAIFSGTLDIMNDNLKTKGNKSAKNG
jgi:hypothetical protein